MQRLSTPAPEHGDTDYQAIESALVETARGRWFLAEHSRRARRIDGALLEDAIGRLQTSLRQPPALLGQLQHEIETLKAHLAQSRAALLERPHVTTDTSYPDGAVQPQAIMKAAEDIHQIAWALQANPFDPKACEDIARLSSRLYALSLTQAVESTRALQAASAIDAATGRLEAMLETVMHEMRAD